MARRIVFSLEEIQAIDSSRGKKPKKWGRGTWVRTILVRFSTPTDAPLTMASLSNLPVLPKQGEHKPPRSVAVGFRCTEQEAELLDQAHGPMSFASWGRDIVLRHVKAEGSHHARSAT